MKKITQKKFDGFPIDKNGYRICPNGDYTKIKHFDDNCKFSNNCIFGNFCIFGKWCILENECSFGDGCAFGSRCNLGEMCAFGIWCEFKNECKFGCNCIFGTVSNFDDRCSFGNNCSFNEDCKFWSNCSFENGKVVNGKYFSCDRIGIDTDKIYIFIDEKENIFVREKLFFGDEQEFIDKIKKTCSSTKQTMQYLLALELAKNILLP